MKWQMSILVVLPAVVSSCTFQDQGKGQPMPGDEVKAIQVDTQPYIKGRAEHEFASGGNASTLVSGVLVGTRIEMEQSRSVLVLANPLRFPLFSNDGKVLDPSLSSYLKGRGSKRGTGVKAIETAPADDVPYGDIRRFRDLIRKELGIRLIEK